MFQIHFKGHVKPKHRMSSWAEKIIISNPAYAISSQNNSFHQLRIQWGGSQTMIWWQGGEGGGSGYPKKWWRHLWTAPNTKIISDSSNVEEDDHLYQTQFFRKKGPRTAFFVNNGTTHCFVQAVYYTIINSKQTETSTASFYRKIF